MKTVARDDRLADGRVRRVRRNLNLICSRSPLLVFELLIFANASFDIGCIERLGRHLELPLLLFQDFEAATRKTEVFIFVATKQR